MLTLPLSRMHLRFGSRHGELFGRASFVACSSVPDAGKSQPASPTPNVLFIRLCSRRRLHQQVSEGAVIINVQVRTTAAKEADTTQLMETSVANGTFTKVLFLMPGVSGTFAYPVCRAHGSLGVAMYNGP
jgi:hypothetical protein